MRTINNKKNNINDLYIIFLYNLVGLVIYFYELV